jgi:hypothetical protein
MIHFVGRSSDGLFPGDNGAGVLREHVVVLPVGNRVVVEHNLILKIKMSLRNSDARKPLRYHGTFGRVILSFLSSWCVVLHQINLSEQEGGGNPTNATRSAATDIHSLHSEGLGLLGLDVARRQ